jgi:hypothetical protein
LRDWSPRRPADFPSATATSWNWPTAKGWPDPNSLMRSASPTTAPRSCPELAATLSGWDGVFTVLVRKRTARHIESCPTCDDYRRSLVNSVAMVGNAVIKKLS